MRSSYLFTSESVSEGHPDKVADQISDAIVDLFLSKDPEARVACETLATTNRVVLGGEIRCQGDLWTRSDSDTMAGRRASRDEIEQTVRDTVKRDRLRAGRLPLADRLDFDNHLHAQSAHIAQGVDAGEQQGRRRRRPGHHVRLRLRRDPGPDAGDALLQPQDPRARWPPTAIRARAPFLEPDAKSQVTLRFEDGKPAKATAIVVSTQHKPGLRPGREASRAARLCEVGRRRRDARPSCSATRPSITSTRPAASRSAAPTATPASPAARSSSTPTAARPRTAAARSSGKDPTKVDRSAAYAARYLAKNIVAAGLAKRCTIQLAYAIGVSKPLSLYVDTHGTGTVGDDAARGRRSAGSTSSAASPRAASAPTSASTSRSTSATAAYGHFGRKAEGDFFPWEKTDLVEDLKAALA